MRLVTQGVMIFALVRRSVDSSSWIRSNRIAFLPHLGLARISGPGIANTATGQISGCFGYLVEKRCLSRYSKEREGRFKEGVRLLAKTGKDDEVDKPFDLFEGIPTKNQEFRIGQAVMVEVLSFGPLGATVAVIGKSHDPQLNLPENEPPLGIGLIYQDEIARFRMSRRNVDVVLGEILPAYIERVRADGKIDVSLRVVGGRAKVEKWSGEILARLHEAGILPIGNKSTPQEIAREFPGMSKSDFKKIIGALFERKKVFPFHFYTKSYSEGSEEDAALRRREDSDRSGTSNF